jgi:gamma-glutamylcyclotransferase (GGCT)/AIG2-like uncharacterized protein YtfP
LAASIVDATVERSMYFAYGSNMSSAVMEDRCAGVESMGAARLDGHRLAFSLPSLRWGGHAADLAVDEGSAVWGVLWRVSDEHLAALDGVETRYDRYPIMVAQNDSGITATTYRVKRDLVAPTDGNPDPAYLATILEGAAEHALPDNYVRALRSRYRVPGT